MGQDGNSKLGGPRLNRIAIIGGGWAGLACALELTAAGQPVTLLEAAKQLGGRARSVNWNALGTGDGPSIDNGQHLMIGAYRETQRLLARLNTAHLQERRPLELIVPGFRLRLPRLPASLHLGFGLLAAQGLSLREKLAAARFMQTLKSTGFRLQQDLSAEALFRLHHQPQALIDRLWGPLCIAALNTPLKSASAQIFCNVLRDSLMGPRANSDLLMNRSDLSRLLPTPAAAWLTDHGCEIRLSSKVTRLVPADYGFQLGDTSISVKTVVAATSPARLPALLADLPEMAEVATQVGRYHWQPILTLWLHFEASPIFPFPMLGLDAGHAPWAFERNDLAPGMVSVVMSAEGPHLNQSAETLRDEYLGLLAHTLGPLPPLLAWKLITEKRATYACTPNQPRPGNRTALPNLFLAGDYTAGPYPATLEGAVRSGVECARLILER